MRGGRREKLQNACFVVPGAVENHSLQHQEALTGRAGASPEIPSTSVSAQR